LHIRSRKLSIIYKTVIIACTAAGLMLTCGIPEGQFRPEIFAYFTNLSNLFVLIYFTGDVIFLLCTPKGRTGESGTWLPVFKGVVTMAILLTGLVAAILLGNLFANSSGSFKASLIFLHDIVPVLTVLDYFLFDRKGRIGKFWPLVWTALPVIYLTFVTAAAGTGSSLGSETGSKYPYPFLDADRLGLPQVIRNVILIAAVYIAVGYLAYFIDSRWKAKEKDS